MKSKSITENCIIIVNRILSYPRDKFHPPSYLHNLSVVSTILLNWSVFSFRAWETFIFHRNLANVMWWRFFRKKVLGHIYLSLSLALIVHREIINNQESCWDKEMRKLNLVYDHGRKEFNNDSWADAGVETNAVSLHILNGNKNVLCYTLLMNPT